MNAVSVSKPVPIGATHRASAHCLSIGARTERSTAQTLQLSSLRLSHCPIGCVWLETIIGSERSTTSRDSVDRESDEYEEVVREEDNA
ncbi:unnamed protein product [Medioppia subpectinata]|uniref:Uncharacterized protein n=1 Tax=Medioppia subpectinata TaxID=1979941 RepID=A0A7R9L1C8_9ACAR|nr:unnamed protein product [Medioppia subpectinata]CAG2113692.1 unnamed protein product [Medioppia subpectinata]